MMLGDRRELDDWSGKKTVKMRGRIQQQNLTATSKRIASNGIRSSFSKTTATAATAGTTAPLSTTRKERELSSSMMKQPIAICPSADSKIGGGGGGSGASGGGCDSSTDEISMDETSADDNSTIALNKNLQNVDIEVYRHDGDHLLDDVDSLDDDYSLEHGCGGGNGSLAVATDSGGCFSCGVLNVEMTLEDEDHDLLNYWNRVKANRRKDKSHQRNHSWSGDSQSSIGSQDSSDQNSIVQEVDDDTQIEVVHEVKPQDQKKPNMEHVEELEQESVHEVVSESKTFVRSIKKMSSRSQRALMGAVDKTVTVAVGVVDKMARKRPSPLEGETRETPLKPRRQLSDKLTRMLSKENLFALSSAFQRDKSAKENQKSISYHSLASFVSASSSDMAFGDYDDDKYRVEEEELTGLPSSDENPAVVAEGEAMQSHITEQELEGELGRISAYGGTLGSLEVGSSTICSKAIRSRASLVKIAQDMEFNADELTSTSSGKSTGVSNSDSIENDPLPVTKRRSMRSALHFVAKRGGSVNKRLTKGLKKGVIRLQNVSTRKSSDQKSTSVGSTTVETKQQAKTENETASNEDASVTSVHSSVLPTISLFYNTEKMELGGPVEKKTDLGDASVEPVDDESTNELNNVEMNKEEISKNELFQKTNKKELTKSQSSLTELGIEATFLTTQSDLQSRSSVGSDIDSSASYDSESSSSEGDLNSLGSNTSDLMYDLFSVNSFSSLTGVKCHEMGCATDFRSDMHAAGDLQSSTVQADFSRGRTRKRTENRRAVKEKLCKSPNSIGFNTTTTPPPMTRYGGDADSIMECTAQS